MNVQKEKTDAGAADKEDLPPSCVSPAWRRIMGSSGVFRPFSSAYAGNHGLGRGGMRNSGWGFSGNTITLLRRISLPGG